MEKDQVEELRPNSISYSRNKPRSFKRGAPEQQPTPNSSNTRSGKKSFMSSVINSPTLPRNRGIADVPQTALLSVARRPQMQPAVSVTSPRP